MKAPTTYSVHQYPELEEKLNIWSHFAGILFSLFAMVLLCIKAVEIGKPEAYFGFLVYGLTMILLYCASTFYHSAKSPKLRYRLNILDHASIFVFIAGSYTPFTLMSLKGAEGWTIFSIVWGITVLGVVLKIFFTGKFNLLSTLLYIGMGWIIVFNYKSILNAIHFDGFLWLMLGGLAYTIGAVFYSINRIKFNHAIFHLFVLMGTVFHFFAIYFFVSP